MAFLETHNGMKQDHKIIITGILTDCACVHEILQKIADCSNTLNLYTVCMKTTPYCQGLQQTHT